MLSDCEGRKRKRRRRTSLSMLKAPNLQSTPKLLRRSQYKAEIDTIKKSNSGSSNVAAKQMCVRFESLHYNFTITYLFSIPMSTANELTFGTHNPLAMHY